MSEKPERRELVESVELPQHPVVLWWRWTKPAYEFVRFNFTIEVDPVTSQVCTPELRTVTPPARDSISACRPMSAIQAGIPWQRPVSVVRTLGRFKASANRGFGAPNLSV